MPPTLRLLQSENSEKLLKTYVGQVELEYIDSDDVATILDTENLVTITQKMFGVKIDAHNGNSHLLMIRTANAKLVNRNDNSNPVAPARDTELIEHAASFLDAVLEKSKNQEKMTNSALTELAKELAKEDVSIRNIVFNNIQAYNILDMKANTGRLDLLFTVQGKVLNELKEKYGILFSRNKSRITITDPNNSFDLEKLKQSEKVLKKVLEISNLSESISDKYMDVLVNGPKTDSTNVIKPVWKNNVNNKTNAKQTDTNQKILDLESELASKRLFSKDDPVIPALEKIFNVKIRELEETKASIRPSNHAMESDNKSLVVSQASDTLACMVGMIVSNQEISPYIISETALGIANGAPNMNRIQTHVKSYLKQTAPNETDHDNRYPLIGQMTMGEITQLRFIITNGQFANNLIENEELTNALKSDLGVSFSYHGRDKAVTIEKTRKSKVDIKLAEKVLRFAHDEYINNIETLQIDHLKNTISNALNGRPLDEMADSVALSIKDKKRLEAHKLQTYNKSGEFKFIYPKSEGQYEVYNAFFGQPCIDQQRSFEKYGKRIIIGIGPAAAGKTSYAIFCAVHAFKMGWIKHLILTRPLVPSEGEDIGAIPGNIAEKTAPFMMPLYENILKVMPDKEIAKYIREAKAPGSLIKLDEVSFKKEYDSGQTIEIAPLAFMQGRTFPDAVMVGDEMQNATKSQIKTFLTRIRPGGRAFVSLDMAQINLPNKLSSGAMSTIITFCDAKNRGRAKAVQLIALNGNMRDGIVTEVLDAYETFDNGGIEITKDNREKTVDDYYHIASVLIGRQEDTSGKILQFKQNKKDFRQRDEEVLARLVKTAVEISAKVLADALLQHGLTLQPNINAS